jgi:hypothetical protein
MFLDLLKPVMYLTSLARRAAALIRPRRNYTATPFLLRINMTIDKIRNTKNKTLEISMAEPAILVNPSTAAIIAITRNVTAQSNIGTSSQLTTKNYPK